MTTPPESCRCPSRDRWLRTGICPEATGAIYLDSSILRDPEVAVLVIGARGTPAGRRPIGHAAMQLINSVAKPLVVVPPTSVSPSESRGSWFLWTARPRAPRLSRERSSWPFEHSAELSAGTNSSTGSFHQSERKSKPRSSS